jgi:hypothetical protein
VNGHVHVDQHWLDYQPNTNRLFVLNDGGIYYSADHGVNWENISGGLVINQPYRISNSQQVYNKIIMGQQDNGIVLWENDSIRFVGGGDGTDCLINPLDHNHQIKTSNSPNVWFTLDNWTTYHQFPAISDPYRDWFKPIVLLPMDTIYYGVSNIWKSTDKGYNFTKICEVPEHDSISLRRIAIAPSNHQVAYFFNEMNLYKTSDDFLTFSVITDNLPAGFAPESIYQIAVKETDPNTLWITNKEWNDGHSVYRSVDGGLSWEDISAGLPDAPWHDIIYNKLQTGYEELYVGGYLGVYVKMGNTNWIPFMNGLPNVVSYDIDIYYDGSNSKLRKGTHGRGVWETDILSTDPGSGIIWTGNYDDNWHDYRNWHTMSVPAAGQNVFISSIAAFSPRVYQSNANCGDIEISPGGQLSIEGKKLTLSGGLVIEGILSFTGTDTDLEVSGNITWKPGSSFNCANPVNNNIRVYGNWILDEGVGNLYTNNADVYFMGDTYSYIYIYGGTCSFGNLFISKDPGKGVIIQDVSTGNINVTGNLTIDAGVTMSHFSPNNLTVVGNIHSPGYLYFPDGNCVLSGNDANIHLGTSTSFFNRLEINATGGKIKTFTSDIQVNGNLILTRGTMKLDGYSLKLKGDLEKSAGLISAVDGRIVFNGSNRQSFLSNLLLPAIELAKPSDTLFIDSRIIICTHYDWTEGTLAVTGEGSFETYDLLDDGIFGSFYLKDSGSIELNQDAGQTIDLNGIIRIEGGHFQVNGGSIASSWPGGVNSELWMSDGILDFVDQGIHLTNAASFLEVITGGVIRTSRSFTSNRNDFTPIGGYIELYGTTDANLAHGIGGAFWEVRIAKTSGTVSAIQNLTFDNKLMIQSGVFDANGQTISIADNLDISGTLKMTLPSSAIHVNDHVYWRPGSGSDISDGQITFKKNWYFENGTNAQMTGNNTVKANSSSFHQFVYHQDSDACFAHFISEKPFVSSQRHLYLDADSDYPMRVNGNLTLLNTNSLRVDGADLVVGGTVQADNGSFVRVQTGGTITTNDAVIDGILNLFGGTLSATSVTIGGGIVMTDYAIADLNDLTLNGVLSMDPGSVTVHNNFNQGSAGHLILDSGSFILDKPYTGNLFGFSGTTDLNGGFFEISYDGIQFGTGATVNFNGGNLRIGGHFRALNPNSFQPTSGTVELINTIGTNIEVTNGNYFHRLVIDKSGSNACIPLYPLTINDQFVLQRGEYLTNNQGLYIGEDLIIESLGKLTAGSAEIYVGGDWVNNRGTTGFVENTSSVWLTPAQTSTISSETFNELVIQAATAPGVYASMAPNSTITVNGDLILSEGALLMNDNCTLNANSVVFIKNGGGLNANPDATGTVINCPGHWWDYNTVANDQHSFTCGQSTVNFTGAGDQQVIAYPGAIFHHLNIQKTGGALIPSNNITVLGEMNLQNGEWDYASTGLTHTFMGDFNVFPGASWLDDQNTVSFEGELWQTLSNTTANPLDFGAFRVDRPADMSGFGSFTIDSDIGCSVANFVSGWIYVADHDFNCMGDMNIMANTYAQFVFNSTIRMANNKMINVNGGYLFVGGDPANRSLVTHLNSGYYKVLVSGGGHINSVYTTWEWLGTRGIEFAADGYVSGSFPFYECILRDGIPGGSLFYMGNSADITLHNVNFPANTWGGAYNVAKYEDAGNVYLPGATGTFAGPLFEHDPYGRIHWPASGIWEGDESTEWHNVQNWRYDFQVPDATTDVVIPAGVPYFPNFHQVETTIKSLKVDANASLTISRDSLTVLTTTDIAGALNLSADYTALFTDSIVWQAGSVATMADRATVYVSGNMFIRRGSGLDLSSGTFYFHGNQDSDLICHDTAAIYHLDNYKPAPHSLHLVGDTLAQFTVKGNFRNGTGATLKCPSTQEWVFNGQFRNTSNGHFRCQNGTIRLTGSTTASSFRPNQGDYFNNLVVETTTALNLNSTYSDTLRIHGDLTINPGNGTSSLTANNFKIMIWGDWTNNVGTTGFNPGTSEVWFWHSSNPQSISGNTSFNALYAHNNPNGLSINGNNTVDDLLLVLYPLHVNGNLTANVVNIDDSPSELHLYDGCYMQAGTLIQGGTVHAHGGTFMVNDLNEDGIFGVYIVDNGLVVLGQEEYSTSHDVMGSITINGGELRCTGGSGSSAWPANIVGSYASLTMTGGLFHLPIHWIEILNNSFTENITGGTIRVHHGFYCTAGVTTFHSNRRRCGDRNH